MTAISEKTRQELYRYIGKLADKVTVIPCNYDPAFSYCPRAFNKTYPNLLHIGSAPHKNLSRLIKAIEGLPCRLTILGKLTAEIQAEIVQRKIDYVNYVDVTQSQVVSLYQKCDLVTFVSLYEGFGLPVVEAQVVGRPVITSNISPMIEVAGGAACLVDPTDISAIRQGIERICNDDAYRADLIQKGRVNAERFSVAAVATKYLALYESLGRQTRMSEPV
ncbi:hypothetical protein GCM10023187_25070 [Nibrella viscosa]|uniref:Glycosyl transferase family 1 domain-containing protein n=1 Tax=Nibrella viscosa TaxID=1084524 RepID=A0ABP8KH24_9BACT